MKKFIPLLIVFFIACNNKKPDSVVQDKPDPKIEAENLKKKQIDLAVKKTNDSLFAEKAKALPGKLKKMNAKKDDFKGVTFYKPKGTPSGYSSELESYVVEKGKDRYMRVKFQYTANDWLFVKKISFKCDNTILEYIPNKMTLDNDGGEIYEYEDVTLDDPNVKNIIYWVTHAGKVTVRYDGDKHYDERVMSKAEIKRLTEVYDLFY